MLSYNINRRSDIYFELSFEMKITNATGPEVEVVIRFLGGAKCNWIFRFGTILITANSFCSLELCSAKGVCSLCLQGKLA